jgi:uncharacterized protein involved in exopolysaccharide biosynthesis
MVSALRCRSITDREGAHVMTLQTPKSQITLELLLPAMARGWRTLLVSFVSITALAVVSAFVIPPRYRAEVVVIPVRPEDARTVSPQMSSLGQLGSLSSIPGISNVGAGNPKDEYISYLQSRTLAAHFIEANNLLPVLFYKKWNEQTKQWADPSDVPSLADGIKFFNEHVVSVQEERRTGIVTVSVIWKTPELSADWANQFVGQANKDLRERAIKDSDASTHYLRDELNKTSEVELRQAIYRVMENEIKTSMLANVHAQYALKVIDAARAPDISDRARPKRGALIAVGMLLGMMLGTLLIALRLRRG